MIIKGYRVGPLLKRTGQEIIDDNVLGLSAQLAYYFFLSLFPIFLFLAPLLSYVGDKRTLMNFIVGQLDRTVPGEALALIRGVITDVVFSPGAPGLISIGALLALWAGSNIFSAMGDALNRAYDVEDKRPWWKKRLIAIGMLALSGVTVALATVILLGGEDVVAWVSGLIGLSGTGRLLWTVLQFPLAISVLVALGCATFYVLPYLKQNKWHILVASVTATLLWLLVTLAFRFYVQNFGDYNKTYGTIGGVIVLLTWMYLSMFVLLASGELASELHRGTGAIDPRRGATLGDRISSATGGASTDRIERVVPITARGRE